MSDKKELLDKWSNQISETRKMLREEYENAIDEDDYEVAEVIDRVRSKFEDIDDKYLWYR